MSLIPSLERLGVPYLQIECIDCGRRRVWSTDGLRRVGVREDEDRDAVVKRLVCSLCRSAGMPGRDLEVRPDWTRAPWSTDDIGGLPGAVTAYQACSRRK